MRYNLKIDWWIRLIFYLTIGVLFVPVLFLEQKESFFYIAPIFPITVILLWFLFGSYYELKDDELYMKFGPFFGRVPYDNIKSVSLSNNWTSSWAMTMKRVSIKVRNKTTLKGDVQVGPLDTTEFMDELIRRCRNLDKMKEI